MIFDIDGLLIDSEPLWNEAAKEVFAAYNIQLTEQEYLSTTGLRTKEFVDWWFTVYEVPKLFVADAENAIIETVLGKIKRNPIVMQGVGHIVDFFLRQGFKLGLATSSPQALIDLVSEITGMGKFLTATASAQELPFGKPHPQVYLDCAAKMAAVPTACLCFEDSFNGMIAAKAARMKCVVVPAPHQAKEDRWAAADLKLSSLQNFGELHFNILNGG